MSKKIQCNCNQNPKRLANGIGKTVPNFILKCKRLKIAKIFLKMKNKMGGLASLDTK